MVSLYVLNTFVLFAFHMLPSDGFKVCVARGPKRLLATMSESAYDTDIEGSDLASVLVEENAESLAPTARDPDDSNFMRWYRYEMEYEKYKKENPIDPLERLRGPLLSVAAILIGFLCAPLVKRVIGLVNVEIASE